MFVIDSTGTIFHCVMKRNDGARSDNWKEQLIAVAGALDEVFPHAKMIGSTTTNAQGVTLKIHCSTILRAVYFSPDSVRPIVENLMSELLRDNPALHTQVTSRARQLLTDRPIVEMVSPSPPIRCMLLGEVWSPLHPHSQVRYDTL